MPSKISTIPSNIFSDIPTVFPRGLSEFAAEQAGKVISIGKTGLSGNIRQIAAAVKQFTGGMPETDALDITDRSHPGGKPEVTEKG